VIYPGYLSQNDNDGDGIPNFADPYPNVGDEFVYQGIRYVTVLNDDDRDGVPNVDGDNKPVDLYPEPGQGYWYPGTKYDPSGANAEYPSFLAPWVGRSW
jgi:hypothetical protein